METFNQPKRAQAEMIVLRHGSGEGKREIDSIEGGADLHT